MSKPKPYYSKSFGVKLTNHMEVERLPVSQVAQLLGRSESTIRRWAKGVQAPKSSTELQRVCDKLDWYMPKFLESAKLSAVGKSGELFISIETIEAAFLNAAKVDDSLTAWAMFAHGLAWLWGRCNLYGLRAEACILVEPETGLRGLFVGFPIMTSTGPDRLKIIFSGTDTGFTMYLKLPNSTVRHSEGAANEARVELIMPEVKKLLGTK